MSVMLISSVPRPEILPSSVWIQPWSRLIMRRECRWRTMAATIPGTPATVSRNIIRLKQKKDILIISFKVRKFG